MKQIGILTDNFEIVEEIMSGVQSFIEQQNHPYLFSKIYIKIKMVLIIFNDC